MKVEQRGELFYDDQGNLLGFAPDASQESRQQYRMAVQWAPVVSSFSTLPTDKLPDGRTFNGQRVGDVRGANGRANLKAPNGSMQDVDLSAYGPDDRIRITWENQTAKRLKEMGS